MWIKSYKLERNAKLPNYVIDHLRNLVYELKKGMQERLGRHYTIHLRYSVHSEAAYITISKDNSSYKISIRNHTTKSKCFDKAYYLDNFHTWDEFMNFFLSKELRQIKDILNNKKTPPNKRGIFAVGK
ncbi:hypothetical protein [Ornithinibacillus bavariensis]|uniref:hypothetical protein n=1 Tax=Ornithinibacillus bavariensis TaxID=545502 RepID=UPI000EEDF830|nr:hypothetical protein [Ornithinibacillus sp.]